jgi:transposase-like protein
MNLEHEIEKRARDIIKEKRRLFVVKCISDSKKSITQECEEFGIPRSTFYVWRKRYELIVS